MTTERDDIEKWLNGINKFVTKLSEPASYKFMGLIESHGELRELYFNHCSKLLALVRCYQEAIQDELKRCGGTVPILKAALKKAKEIIK